MPGFSTADLLVAFREAPDDPNEDVQFFATRAFENLEDNLPNSVP